MNIAGVRLHNGPNHRRDPLVLRSGLNDLQLELAARILEVELPDDPSLEFADGLVPRSASQPAEFADLQCAAGKALEPPYRI